MLNQTITDIFLRSHQHFARKGIVNVRENSFLATIEGLIRYNRKKELDEYYILMTPFMQSSDWQRN